MPFAIGFVATRARVKRAAWLLRNGDAHRAHVVKTRRRLFGGRRYDIAWSDHRRERRARIRTGRKQRADELAVVSTLRDDVVVVVTGDGSAYVRNCRP